MNASPGQWSISQAPVCGCSRQGAAHRLKQLPCQDAWRFERLTAGPREALVVTVADGHGAPIHDLSRIGAQLAVQAAVEEAARLLSEPRTDAPLRELRFAFRTDFPRRVVECWRTLVHADYRERVPDDPVSPDDAAHVYHRYGSTLLTAIVLEKELLVTTIGDGNALLIRPDGAIGLHVEQNAPELPGPMTFSLASNSPELLFQTQVVPRKDGGLLLLSTDGVINSFINPTYFFAFASGLQDRIRDLGMDEAANALPGWLDYLSTHGSGDDVSLVIAWLEDGPLVPRFRHGPPRLWRTPRRCPPRREQPARRLPLTALDYRGFALGFAPAAPLPSRAWHRA